MPPASPPLFPAPLIPVRASQRICCAPDTWQGLQTKQIALFAYAPPPQRLVLIAQIREADHNHGDIHTRYEFWTGAYHRPETPDTDAPSYVASGDHAAVFGSPQDIIAQKSRQKAFARICWPNHKGVQHCPAVICRVQNGAPFYCII